MNLYLCMFVRLQQYRIHTTYCSFTATSVNDIRLLLCFVYSPVYSYVFVYAIRCWIRECVCVLLVNNSSLNSWYDCWMAAKVFHVKNHSIHGNIKNVEFWLFKARIFNINFKVIFLEFFALKMIKRTITKCTQKFDTLIFIIRIHNFKTVLWIYLQSKIHF